MEMEAVSNAVSSRQCFITEVENSFDFKDNSIYSLCHDFCCDECTSNDFYMATREVTKDLENHIFCCDENTYNHCKDFMPMHKETTRKTIAETATNSPVLHATTPDVMSVRPGHQKDDVNDTHFVAKAADRSKKKKTKRKKQKEKLAKLMQKYTSLEGKSRSTSRYADSFKELLSPKGFDSKIDSTLTCPVCLDLYFRPHQCHPCQHVFCEPCLRKLTTKSAEFVPCPLCRKVIQSCSHDKGGRIEGYDKLVKSVLAIDESPNPTVLPPRANLDQRLKVDYPDIYQERARIENLCKSRYNQLPLTCPVPVSRRLMQSLIQGHQAQRYILNWLYGLGFSSLAYLLPLGLGLSMSFLLFLYHGKLQSESQVESANSFFLVMVLGLILAYFLHKSQLLKFAILNR